MPGSANIDPDDLSPLERAAYDAWQRGETDAHGKPWPRSQLLSAIEADRHRRTPKPPPAPADSWQPVDLEPVLDELAGMPPADLMQVIDPTYGAPSRRPCPIHGPDLTADLLGPPRPQPCTCGPADEIGVDWPDATDEQLTALRDYYAGVIRVARATIGGTQPKLDRVEREQRRRYEARPLCGAEVWEAGADHPSYCAGRKPCRHHPETPETPDE